MKKLILITLAILATQFSYANGGKKDFTKEINKSFSVGNSPNLEIDNHFGDIKIIRGTQGKIEINVLITVSAKNQAKADKLFESIHVNLEETLTSVKGITNIGKRGTLFDSWSFSWSSDDDNFSVDYIITVPENTNVELANQHGDIMIQTDVAKADIDLQFGDLEVENITGKLDLEIAHGDAKISSLVDADVEVNFGNFICTSVNDLVIDSQHSDVTVTTARDMKIDSGFGDYTIGTVESLLNDGSHSDFEISTVGAIIAESSFTSYVIENIMTSFHIENEHGGTKIKELDAGFKDGYVESSFGDINISTDNYLDLTITGTFMTANLPSNFDIKTKIIEDHDTDIKGTLNTGAGTMGTVKIDLEHGSFRIK